MLDWLKNRFASGSPADKARTEACAEHDSGHWERAVELLRPIAAQHPDDADVLYRLGDALYQQNRLDEALPPLERATGLAGGVAAHHYKLGNVLKDLERLDDALRSYRRALELDPGHAQALNNAGTVLEVQGKTEEALHHYQQAVRADRTLLPAQGNLAVLLHRQERFSEAIKVYEELLKLQPRSVADWCNLGNAYQGLERYDDAIRCYERALALDPTSADAHYHSGVALLNLGRFPEAEAATRRASEIAPGHVESWVNLGASLEAQRRFDDALGAYQRGLGLNVDMPELLNNIGTAYKHKGALEAAEGYFKRALEIAPQFGMARVNLATLRNALGLVDEAISAYREILESEPQSEHAARHLLMALLYTPCSNAELFSAHLSFAQRFGSGKSTAPAWTRGADPGRKIRIGYVSSDLRRHPVGFNLAPIIRMHDRSRFEVYLYSSARRPDEMSRWFREQATAWRSIAFLSDEAAAQRIRQDEVDILVLLAGRFDENRPLLALHRAAPVQVSMHDPATSGLAEIDYLIADRGLVPRRAPEKFTERVVCLPTFYLHGPLEEAPRLPLPPVTRNGFVTFGSFNNPAKINDEVVALWARVLSGVPGSRLLLKFQGVLALPGVRARIANRFRRHGIGEERLVIPVVGDEDRARHLARYGDMDIALDPFPFTGSTTTFESLWMGVPVVTLEGDRMVSRWSSAMLRKAGLPRLIARTGAEYVEIARELASNPDELARLRAGLRDRVARSPLCAEAARARQLERLYRRMWAIWLNQRS